MVWNMTATAPAAWLNNYPRRILAYYTPAELFQAELEALR